MTGSDDPIHDLSTRLRFLLAQPVDFRLTDTETTIAKVRILTAAAMYLNLLAVTEHGGRHGIVRAPGMVEQVIGAAFQTYGGIDPHANPFEKAGMLLRGITQGHPFADGNKRTGFLVASFYLNLMGIALPPSFDVERVVALCLDVSAGTIRDVAAMASALQEIWNSES